jgi:Transposase IS66 family
MTAGKRHADDTPAPVLAPGQGRTKQGRLWTYGRDDRPAGDRSAPAVWFTYSPDHRGEHPHRHLADFKGTLQADAYAGLQPAVRHSSHQGGGERYLFFTGSIQYFREGFALPFIAKYAVQQLRVTVKYPKTDFEISLDPTLASVEQACQPAVEKMDETSWVLKQPVLPGQGLIVRWDKKVQMAVKTVND